MQSGECRARMQRRAVLGNSRPPQPPHVSEGQPGTSESQGADSKPELLGIWHPLWE